jgi:hypothetical protein
MVGETKGEPLVASYEDLSLLLLLYGVCQRTFLGGLDGINLLVAGLEGSGNLLDQVFGHSFGLLEEAGSHCRW